MLDEDGDEVLTKKEIIDGLKLNKIVLNDTEWDEFIKVIDGNHDGVLSYDEWIEIMSP